MLSYMLPVDDKPPPVPPKTHLQLTLDDGGHQASPEGHQRSNGHSEGHASSHIVRGQNGHHAVKSGQNGQVKNGGDVRVTYEGQNGGLNGISSEKPQILGNGKVITTPISKETSISSFVSESNTFTSGNASCNASQSSMTPTSTSEKGKVRLAINGGKHQSLKRVSFGSSKGSMVETLIFESVVQEEPEPSPIPENGVPGVPTFGTTTGCDQSEDEREKVRVTFFQQSKPLEVDLPDEPPFCCTDGDYIMASPVMRNDANHVVYNRTESTESGWDNPFRPGGDLSREADQIVELIKGGKPITPTLQLEQNNISATTVDGVESSISPKKSDQLNSTPQKNGTTTKNASSSPAPGQLDVQRGTIKPEGDGGTVEHVNIKKKKKNCCVVQ